MSEKEATRPMTMQEREKDPCEVLGCEYNQDGKCAYRSMTGRERPGPAGAKCGFGGGAVAAGADRRTTNHNKEDQDALMEERQKLYDMGLTDKEIMEAQCVTSGAVCSWRKRLGLPANQKKKPEPAKEPEPEVTAAAEEVELDGPGEIFRIILKDGKEIRTVGTDIEVTSTTLQIYQGSLITAWFLREQVNAAYQELEGGKKE